MAEQRQQRERNGGRTTLNFPTMVLSIRFFDCIYCLLFPYRPYFDGFVEFNSFWQTSFHFFPLDLSHFNVCQCNARKNGKVFNIENRFDVKRTCTVLWRRHCDFLCPHFSPISIQWTRKYIEKRASRRIGENNIYSTHWIRIRKTMGTITAQCQEQNKIDRNTAAHNRPANNFANLSSVNKWFSNAHNVSYTQTMDGGHTRGVMMVETANHGQ